MPDVPINWFTGLVVGSAVGGAVASREMRRGGGNGWFDHIFIMGGMGVGGTMGALIGGVMGRVLPKFKISVKREKMDMKSGSDKKE